MLKDEIHIVSGADTHYFYGLLVTLDSALAHLSEAYRPVVHVLDGGLEDVDYAFLCDVLERRCADVVCIRHVIDLNLFDGFRVSELHASPMAYARLLLPQLVDLKRVIYIDSDILIGLDLAWLWQREFAPGKCAMVVQDQVVPLLRDDCPWPHDESEGALPYFNSGVMLIDLAYWRKANVGRLTMDLIERDPSVCRCWDQTALNYILKGRVQFLPEVWNSDARGVCMNELELNGVNYHFITYFKPWLGKRPEGTFLYFQLWLERLRPNWMEGADLNCYFEHSHRPLSLPVRVRYRIKRFACRLLKDQKALVKLNRRLELDAKYRSLCASFSKYQDEVRADVMVYLEGI